MQHVKAALLIQLKTELETELGLECRVAGPPNPFLDVLSPESIWRLRIFHPHELIGAAAKSLEFSALLETRVADAELVRLWWRPRTATALHAVVSRWPSASGTAVLLRVFNTRFSKRFSKGKKQ